MPALAAMSPYHLISRRQRPHRTHRQLPDGSLSQRCRPVPTVARELMISCADGLSPRLLHPINPLCNQDIRMVCANVPVSGGNTHCELAEWPDMRLS